MLVAGLQHDIVWEDPDANFARLAPAIAGAAAEGAQLIALTEMYSNGFSMNTDSIAEDPDGVSTAFLVEQARSHGLWICGSIPRKSGSGRPFNQLVLASPDGELHTYAKRHTFSYAGEDEHYASGEATLTVPIAGVGTTFFICYDLRFATDFWRLAPQTDLYVVIANWPAARREHWQALLRARAIENQAYVLGVNRVGTGDGLEYAGDSVLVGPLGELVSTATAGEESRLVGEVDPGVVADVRDRFPFLADRR